MSRFLSNAYRIDLYSNSFGLVLLDALIAATTIEHGLTLLTYNVADFKFIDGLRYKQPPI